MKQLRLPSVLVAVVAGLALADSSVVALALPPIRVDLDASINGLAAVIGVYVLVLAAGLYPSAVLSRKLGAAQLGAIGFAVLAIGSVGCAMAESLEVLLVFRAVQAIGGAAGVLAAFDLLDPGDEEGREERHLWIAAAVFGTAAGPAVGGLLTQAFDWRSIFWIQLPIGLIGAVACTQIAIPLPTHRPNPFKWSPLVALGLLAGGLAAVLFTLVLQLVAGWSVEPIVAALTVSVLPVAAILTSRWSKIPDGPRAAVGCLMVGVGTLCLALVPGSSVLWTIPPQVLAGIGMGLALPALSGGVLPEKTTGDAARLLTSRHAGIVVALLILAPIVNHELTAATTKAEQQAAAALLDSDINPLSKLNLATSLGRSANAAASESPRAELQAVFEKQGGKFTGSGRDAYQAFADRADDSVVAAANRAFRPAYLVAGLMALIAAALLAGGAMLGAFARWRLPAIGAGVAVLALYGAAFALFSPKQVEIQDPCAKRQLPQSGGLGGLVQSSVLKGLDRAACRNGSSREELVIALGGKAAADRYKAKYGVEPVSIQSLTGGLFGGGGAN
ncbi:MAG: MFS transporter [Actinomycetes bacterium]